MAEKVVPRGFDYETHVILACKVYAGLDMLWYTRVDDVNRISDVTTRVLWIWQAGVVIPVVEGIADGVILVEVPGGGPELCHNGTGVVVVIWLAGVANTSGWNGFNEGTGNGVIESCPSRIGRPGWSSRDSFAFLGVGSGKDGGKESEPDDVFDKLDSQHCRRKLRALNPESYCLKNSLKLEVDDQTQAKKGSIYPFVYPRGHNAERSEWDRAMESRLLRAMSRVSWY